MIAYCKIDGKLAAFDGGEGEYNVSEVIQWVKNEHKVERVLVLVHDAKLVEPELEPEVA